MKITEKIYNWRGTLSKRTQTDYIVLHHTATEICSPDDIHRIHLANGWSGIGYHFYIRKDGSVYRGRPIDVIGAHTGGYNSKCLGICFEGNFENEAMNEEQLGSGWDLIAYLKKIYPLASIKRHKDFNATACPGKYFPFEKISASTFEITDAKTIVKSLFDRGIITDKPLWDAKCVSDINAYWLARKLCNMTENVTGGTSSVTEARDVVNELNKRGIITDMPLWLKLAQTDNALYWLCFKGVNMTKMR